MDKELKLTIKTPTKLVYQGQVTRINLPTMSGSITILPNHANMITLLNVGIVQLEDKEKSKFICFKGVIRIQDNTVVILTEDASRPAEDVLQEIQTALKSAQEGRPTSVILPADLLRAEKELKYYLFKQN